ncbi:MAG: class I SAM-dependent methyltransferase [bacterium]
MTDYYRQRLSAERLQRVYQIAPPRVRQYLDSETEYTLSRIHDCNDVLELGCGYGRVLAPLAEHVAAVFGIDNAWENLNLAATVLASRPHIHLAQMDASQLAFADGAFDAVVCVQNGLAAFNVDKHVLISEALRVCRPGGSVLFSTYAPQFWDHRLDWFRRQAAEGLLGPIDEAATGDGIIVCRDGFRAGLVAPDEMKLIADTLDLTISTTIVDESSVFYDITVGSGSRRLSG